MTRLLALTLLLRSMTDAPFAQPKSSSGVLAAQSKAGEAPSLKVPCPNCGGDKQTRRRGIPYACTACLDDEGMPLGWRYVDGNINEPFRRKIGSVEAGVEQRYTAIRCDSCAGNGAFGNGHRCERCGGSGWQEVQVERLAAVRVPLDLDGPELGPSDPVVRAMIGRQRLGDYDDLGLALGALRQEHNGWYRLVVGVFVLAEREEDELPALDKEILGEGMRYLLELMPAEIRVPPTAQRNERVRRDKLKRKAAA